MKKTKIGVIGCGNISGIYLQNLTTKFANTQVVACADLDLAAAKARAEEFNIPKVCTVDELLADKEIQIVLNLTIPKAHAEVSLKILDAGKHVYVEKPLAITMEDGKKVLDKAKEKGLRVSCAPDTFLGAGIQTCRKLIDEGWIGKPIGATAYMYCHGHESWHPAPEFYYQVGGGPMFDMGPYYLTALVSLLGSVSRVTGSTSKAFSERHITSQPKYGKVVDVEIPTHICGIMDFKSGVIANITTTFDVWSNDHSKIEIFGTEGTLYVPDPNAFGGSVKVKRFNSSEPMEIPHAFMYSENSRGIGVSDLAYSLTSGRSHRANGELAYHVLELMHAFHTSSDNGLHVMIQSSCERPEPMKSGLMNEGLLWE